MSDSPDDNFTHNWRVASSASNNSMLQQHEQKNQEEGVLNEVLHELDRERTRRAELEENLRKITEEQAAAETTKEQQESVRRRDLIAMQTERDELAGLVDALIGENKAITSKSCKLPLHVLRLLEILPWDDRVQQYAFAAEEVYQWQIYDKNKKKWIDDLKSFPPFFRTMPIVKPEASQTFTEDEENENKSNHIKRLFGGERPPRECVMTDSSITRVLNINDGYPLPNDGAIWTWVGNWRVVKRVAVTPDHSSPTNAVSNTHVDCDNDGWSYARNPHEFLANPAELCWGNAGRNTSSLAGQGVERPVRQRKWSRKRALLSYPHASERTEHYLKLMADNANFEMTANKLSEQLVETKIQLTECEEQQMKMESEVQQKEKQILDLNQKLTKSMFQVSKHLKKIKQFNDKDEKNKAMPDLEERLSGSFSPSQNDDNSASSNGSGTGSTHQRNVEKIKHTIGGILSEATNLVRFKPDEGTAPIESDADDSSSSSAERGATEDGQGFDWKKISRGRVLNKLKISPATKALPSWRKPESTVSAEDDFLDNVGEHDTSSN